MDNYMKIKTDFEEAGKAIAEKQKMYIENARKSGSTMVKAKGRATGDPNDLSQYDCSCLAYYYAQIEEKELIPKLMRR